MYSTMPVIKFVTALGVLTISRELVSAPEAVFHIAMSNPGWDWSYIAVGTQSFFVDVMRGGIPPHPPSDVRSTSRHVGRIE